MSRRRLRDEDLEGFLDILSGSEYGQDFSDAENDDDIEKVQSIQNFLSEPLSNVETSFSPQIYLCSSSVNEVVTNIENRQSKISNPQPSTSGMTSETTTGTITQSQVPRRSSTMSNTIGHGSRISSAVTVTQRKKIYLEENIFSINFNNITSCFIYWKHKSIVTDTDTDFETPLQYFLWFFGDTLFQHNKEVMHKISFQKNSSKPFTITTNELKKFIGVCLCDYEFGATAKYSNVLGS